jgi:tetratricopeptide (TPR) repeat protein
LAVWAGRARADDSSSAPWAVPRKYTGVLSGGLSADDLETPIGPAAPATNSPSRPPAGGKPALSTNALSPKGEAIEPPPTLESAVLREETNTLATVNLLATPEPAVSPEATEYQRKLDTARLQRHENNLDLAEKTLISLFDSDAPAEFKRPALLELALTAQAQKRLPKAQHIFSQYVGFYPEDASVPEVLLRQGLLYRQMGANGLALAKFYSVMSASLNLKLDQFAYYKRLVLQAQTEIAETYFLQGQFADSAEFFTRLLKLDNPQLNREQILLKLVQSLSNLSRPSESESRARQFLASYSATDNAAEVRFLLADALRKMGRNREAADQVVALLEAQLAKAPQNPETWAYWQRRAGNDIANEFYRSGDYMDALTIYLGLAQLDPSPSWRLPVLYQLGLVYEKLRQPAKAAETYDKILAKSNDAALTNASPGLAAVLEMARWRKDYISWQTNAEIANDLIRIPKSLQVSTNSP